jgi:hypothetical protein
MKKLVMVAVLAVLGACLLVPASAGADRLRMGPFRAFVLQKAFEDYLRTPNSTGYDIDRCSQPNDHKLKCDANIYGETDGRFYCTDYHCYQEVTAWICWRTFTRTLSPHWKPLRIRNRSSRSTCNSETRTDVY